MSKLDTADMASCLDGEPAGEADGSHGILEAMKKSS